MTGDACLQSGLHFIASKNVDIGRSCKIIHYVQWQHFWKFTAKGFKTKTKTNKKNPYFYNIYASQLHYG